MQLFNIFLINFSAENILGHVNLHPVHDANCRDAIFGYKIPKILSCHPPMRLTHLHSAPFYRLHRPIRTWMDTEKKIAKHQYHRKKNIRMKNMQENVGENPPHGFRLLLCLLGLVLCGSIDTLTPMNFIAWFFGHFLHMHSAYVCADYKDFECVCATKRLSTCYFLGKCALPLPPPSTIQCDPSYIKFINTHTYATHSQRRRNLNSVSYLAHISTPLQWRFFIKSLQVVSFILMHISLGIFTNTFKWRPPKSAHMHKSAIMMRNFNKTFAH